MLVRDGYEVREYKDSLAVKLQGELGKRMRLKGKKYVPGFDYKAFIQGASQRVETFADIKRRQTELFNMLESKLIIRKARMADTYKTRKQKEGSYEQPRTISGNNQSLSGRIGRAEERRSIYI